MNTLEFAQKYSELGFSVIPLQPKKKIPLPNFPLEKYFSQYATEADLLQWFNGTQNNIGIITGNISKMFALDIDSDAAKKYLQERFDQLSGNVQSAITNTMAHKTSNGIHLLFRYDPTECPEGVSTQKLWLGKGEHEEIAIKGEGGYIVAPPSIHPDTLQPYELVRDNLPILLTRQEISELVDILGNSRKRQGSSNSRKEGEYTNTLTPEKMADLLKETEPYYTKGNRDQFVFSLAGDLRKSGDVPLDNTERFISLLAGKTHDEELHSRLIVVRNTYKKPIDQVVGYTGLLDIISMQTDKATALKVLKNIQAIIEPKSQTIGNDDDLSDKERLIIEATDSLERLHQFATLDDTKEILVKENGVFKTKGEILILKEIQARYRGKISTRIADEILNNIRRDTFTPRAEFDKDKDIINTKIGFVNWRTGEFIPHSSNSDYKSMNQKTISYDPKARPKLFGKFLGQILYPQEIRTIVELMGYCLLRDNPFESYVVMLGSGGNGKGVLTKILSTILGPQNVSHIALTNMVADIRFATSGLEGKEANIDIEISDMSMKNMAIVKRITSSKEPMSIEKKGKQAYDAYIYAKLWLSGNKLPGSDDDSDGHYRREFIVSFPNKFEDGKNADIDLYKKLTSEEELSGIFNVMLQALRRVMKNKKIYTEAKSIAERRERNRRATNPIKAFWEEAQDPNRADEDHEIKEEFYKGYTRYCDQYKLPKESYEDFCDKVKHRYNLETGREAKEPRRRYWKGVKLLGVFKQDQTKQSVLA